MKIEKIVERRILSLIEINLLVISIFGFAFLVGLPIVKADELINEADLPDISWCCERTSSGAWCQNSLESECDDSYSMTPTGCDSTSYCREGCCYDSQEGICMTRSPLKVCEDSGGHWEDSPDCEIPQCNLGCCLLGDQAAFVTQVRCKKLASFYGLDIDFRTDVFDELTCIDMANSQVKGACVVEVDYSKACIFTTKGNCNENIKSASSTTTTTSDEVASVTETTISGAAVTGMVTGAANGSITGTITGNITFYPDKLCTAEELGTDCAASTTTTCVDGKDEVYYVDTCGNIANIYDASRYNEDLYWNEIVPKEESCYYGNPSSVVGSPTCGNCDYFQGSICRTYDGGQDDQKPTYGTNVCRDLNCYDTYDGNDYKHGETWCVYDSNVGDSNDLVGSRHWRHICMNGEELVEPCADFRNEVCYQDVIGTSQGDFQQAACRANRWQTCFGVTNQEDCENIDKHDCVWMEDVQWYGNPPGADEESESTSSSDSGYQTNTYSTTTSSTNTATTGSVITGFASDDEESTDEGYKGVGGTYTTEEGATSAGQEAISGSAEEEGVTLTGACVPQYAPGFDFWNEDGDAKTICEQADDFCVVKYEEGLISDAECVENCECIGEDWNQTKMEVCTSLGDCGASVGVYTNLEDNSYNVVSGTVSRIITILSKFAVYVLLGEMDVVEAGDPVVAVNPTANLVQTPNQVSGFVHITNNNLITGLGKSVPAGIYKVSGTNLIAENGATYGFNLGPETTSLTQIKGINFATKTQVTSLSSRLWGSGINPSQLGTASAEQLGKLGISSVKSVDGNTLLNLKDGSTVTYDATGNMIGQQAAQQAGPWAGWNMANTIFNSLMWGLLMGGIGALLGTMLGPENSNAGEAGFWAGMAGGTVSSLTYAWMSDKGALGLIGKDSILGGGVSTTGAGAGAFWTSALVGVAISAIVFVVLYKEWHFEVIVFNCDPWEAPTGSSAADNCALCNDDVMRPCSDYRCRSLGQSCALTNADSETDAMCYWQNPHDVTTPTIEPNYNVLSRDHSYVDVDTRPPAWGMSIQRDDADSTCTIDGQAIRRIRSFTPLTFGIVTNEPAQCKIDYNHTTNFEDMSYYFGSNLYLYNHSVTLSVPGMDNSNYEYPALQEDGVYTLYVRCQDPMENWNTDEYAIRFCVDDGPDTTPPEIVGTNPLNGMPIQYNLNETQVEVYVNEPAECRWSKQDRDYDQMSNSFSCRNSATVVNNQVVYKCTATLTGLENRKNNEFYFRCKDQPGKPSNDRFENTESYKYTLIGTQPLYITDIEPNGTIQGFANVMTVTLTAETSYGYNEGDADCYYSVTGNERDYVRMFGTGSNIHNQTQSLTEGNYTYYIKCVDDGGNSDYNQTSFQILIDRNAPNVVRVYKSGERLIVLTDEDSECTYSTKDCSFNLEDGESIPYANSTEHSVAWSEEDTYYIKCRDESGNQPLPRYCSIIAKGWELNRAN